MKKPAATLLHSLSPKQAGLTPRPVI